jgi:hypothetical protein
LNGASKGLWKLLASRGGRNEGDSTALDIEMLELSAGGEVNLDRFSGTFLAAAVDDFDLVRS